MAVAGRHHHFTASPHQHRSPTVIPGRRNLPLPRRWGYKSGTTSLTVRQLSQRRQQHCAEIYRWSLASRQAMTPTIIYIHFHHLPRRRPSPSPDVFAYNIFKISPKLPPYSQHTSIPPFLVIISTRAVCHGFPRPYMNSHRRRIICDMVFKNAMR